MSYNTLFYFFLSWNCICLSNQNLVSLVKSGRKLCWALNVTVGLGLLVISLYGPLPLRPLSFCHLFCLWIPVLNALFPATSVIAIGCQSNWPFTLCTKVLQPQSWNLPLPKTIHFKQFQPITSHLPLLWQRSSYCLIYQSSELQKAQEILMSFTQLFVTKSYTFLNE